MVIELFCLLCAIGLALGGSLGFWPVQHGYDFYRPVLLFFGGYLGGVFLSWWIMAFNGLFVDQKHEHERVSGWSRFWLRQGMHFINTHALVIHVKKNFGKIPSSRRFLLVCNHRSKFDSMLLSDSLWKKDIAFFTKRSNMKIPLGHKFMWGICYLPLDRDDKLQSLAQMRRAEHLIETNACSIGVFPEGTRQNEKAIGTFHEGCFNVALHTHSPIVVVTSKNGEKIHKNFPFRFTKVTQEVIAVIEPEEYEGMTAKAVSDMVLALMTENLKEAYPDHGDK